MRNICKVDGCDRVVDSWGYCQKHHVRLRKHGDPMVVMNAPAGSGHANARGYRMMHLGGKRRLEHILVVEKALGRKIPNGCQVHHVNRNPSDNRPENLVLCPDAKYHKLLHSRTRALDECGHADWFRCPFCKQWDDPSRLLRMGIARYHRECRSAQRKAERAG